MKVPLLIIITFLSFSIFAQVDFKEDTDLFSGRGLRSTLSLAISDLNGDYKDDIVLLEEGTKLILGYQNGRNTAFDVVENGQILENPAWALSVGDLNNDGIAEIFACGISTYGNIFKRNEFGGYQLVQQLFGLTFPQNSNMADIDNDGWLDIFVCDERAYNDLFLNDQSGNMVYNDYIDMHTIPESDNSGNYGSEWVDFDDDRDIDLFITKCKPGIESPEDPLRVNVLYQNDGQNNYSEQAKQYGLKNGSQSWTGSFGDLDNDGDLDCFVSNHDTTHVIYRNMLNDTFIDVTSELITPFKSSSIQAAIRDFDNNGYMDIYVTGNRDHMLWNMGNDVWEIDDEPFGILEAFTFATGDLNDDGFLDVITSYGTLNETGHYDDKIWINEGNQNHYLKISFLGYSSNKKGIGAKVKVYSSLGIQTRDVKIGESYGTTNSANVHFGMADLETVDTVIIFWPSGAIDKYYEIGTNQHLIAQESICISPFFDIQLDGSEVLCEGDSVLLSVPFLMEEYHWSNGNSDPELIAREALDISIWGVDGEACAHYSNIRNIAFEPEEIPQLSFLNGGEINCLDDEIRLACSPADAYLWSTGETEQSIEIDHPGSYNVTVTGHCDAFVSETVDINFFSLDPPILESDTITIPKEQVVQLTAEGDSVHWFTDEFSDEVIAVGPVFETGLIDKDTTFYVADYGEHIAASVSVGMEDHMGTKFGSNTLNSGLIFNCWQSFILEEVKVIADEPGRRVIELRQIDEEDGTEHLLTSKVVQLESGTSYIDLDFEIEPGLQYELTTNADSNLLYFGHKSPDMYRSNEGVSFPYGVENIMEITKSIHGSSYYYYFFDWKIRPKSIACFSQRIPQHVRLDTLDNIQLFDFTEQEFHIFPNPATDEIEISWNAEIFPNPVVELIDMFGNIIFKKGMESTRLSLEALPRGLYLIRLTNQHEKRYSRPLVINLQ